MWLQGKTKGERVNIIGFSIVEMMVVIVIIGLLGTLALSKYYTFIARARQAEARMNLKNIGDLQESYKYENEEYDTDTAGVGAFSGGDKCLGNSNGNQMKNELGFRPKDCDNLRYGYTWGKVRADAASTNNNSKRVYPDCDKIDKWQIENKTGNIKNNQDIVPLCKD